MRFKSDWSFSNEAHAFLYAGRIYCVIILFTNAKEIMMAARSRLRDFLRLLLETNFGSQLLEPSSLPKQLQQTIAEHSGRRNTDTASGYSLEYMYISLDVCSKLTL